MELNDELIPDIKELDELKEKLFVNFLIYLGIRKQN